MSRTLRRWLLAGVLLLVFSKLGAEAVAAARIGDTKKLVAILGYLGLELFIAALLILSIRWARKQGLLPGGRRKGNRAE